MIRKMGLDDLDDVMRLEPLLFSSPWTLDSYRFELTENPFAHYVVLEEQGIKGYLGLWIHDESAQITTVGVDPDNQNKGYGSALVEYAIQVCQEKNLAAITLEVRVSNQAALHLYQKFGFRKAAIRKNYYSHPDEDAILMIKQLEQK